jgi:anthranilate phosphoribosyltransferase
MGVRQGVVVHGEDTLDEVSVTGRSMVCFLRESGFEVMELFPEDVGLPRRRMEEIRGGTAPDNARIIRGVLSGEDGAPADVVLLGAAVALAAAGRAADIREGLERARDAIESGRARRTLETVVRLTTEAAFTRGG